MNHPHHTASFRSSDSGRCRRGVLRALLLSIDRLRTIAILHLILINLLLLIIY